MSLYFSSSCEGKIGWKSNLTPTSDKQTLSRLHEFSNFSGCAKRKASPFLNEEYTLNISPSSVTCRGECRISVIVVNTCTNSPPFSPHPHPSRYVICIFEGGLHCGGTFCHGDCDVGPSTALSRIDMCFVAFSCQINPFQHEQISFNITSINSPFDLYSPRLPLRPFILPATPTTPTHFLPLQPSDRSWLAPK